MVTDETLVAYFMMIASANTHRVFISNYNFENNDSSIGNGRCDENDRCVIFQILPTVNCHGASIKRDYLQKFQHVQLLLLTFLPW